jgi:hypothetical protein
MSSLAIPLLYVQIIHTCLIGAVFFAASSFTLPFRHAATKLPEHIEIQQS